MPEILDKAFKRYEDSDLITQMKVRFFFFLCLIMLILIPVIMFYSAYAHLHNPAFRYQINYTILIPPAISFILLIAVMTLIVRGYFFASANIILIISFTALWLVMCFDSSSPVSRLDTITLIIALMVLTPLAVLRSGHMILGYGAINMAGLYLFMFYFKEQLGIPYDAFIDYIADNSVAIMFISTVSLSIFIINRKALDRASKEITERVHAEEALRESEEQFRTLFEHSRDAIMIVEPPFWKFTAANQTFIDMIRIGNGTGDYRSLTPWDVSPENQPDGEPSDRKGRRMIDRAMADGWCLFEWQHRRLDGQVFPATVLLSKCQMKNRTFLQATVRDITERKRAEEQTRASLKEKEVLLKEIHHRVKNNLQVIISLLNLQTGSIKDKDLLNLFNDSTKRIRAMALVHEKLYQSDDISKINFTSYIRTITEELHFSHTIRPGGPQMQIEADEIYLGIDQAIPCGLIVNELIINALKYAFPGGGETCTIRVSLRRSDADAMILIVGDNGIGLPEGIDIENTATLGLQLVNILTNQIRGTYNLDRSSGTTWTFTIPAATSSASG